jgi:hypothetical protein
MTEVATELRQIRMGEINGMSYIAFQPPLSAEEFVYMPRPEFMHDQSRLQHEIDSNVTNPKTNSQQIGFDSMVFEFGYVEDLPQYAARVAAHLGSCTLDPTIYKPAKDKRRLKLFE